MLGWENFLLQCARSESGQGGGRRWLSLLGTLSPRGNGGDLLQLGQELPPLGPVFFCLHTFLLLLLSAGRKNRFPAEEVDAQSPEAACQMMHRRGNLAAPRSAPASPFPESPSPVSGPVAAELLPALTGGRVLRGNPALVPLPVHFESTHPQSVRLVSRVK